MLFIVVVVAFVIAANESMTISYSLLCRRFVASFVAVVVVIIVGVFCFSISSWRLLLLRLACSTFTELVTHSLTHSRGTGHGAWGRHTRGQRRGRGSSRGVLDTRCRKWVNRQQLLR